MSATLIADRSTSRPTGSSSTVPPDTGHLAPIVPIRRSAPAEPARPVRRPSAPPVNRRAGSRGPRYVRGAQAAPWHLSRRGELLLRRVTAAGTAVAVILVLTAAAFAVVRGVSTSPAPTRAIVVQPGQSLWQVAASTAPDADVSDATDQIRTLNHLDGTPLTPGQILLVPVAH